MKDKGGKEGEDKEERWSCQGGWEEIREGERKHPRDLLCEKDTWRILLHHYASPFVVVAEVPKWGWERAQESVNSSAFFFFSSSKQFLLHRVLTGFRVWWFYGALTEFGKGRFSEKEWMNVLPQDWLKWWLQKTQRPESAETVKKIFKDPLDVKDWFEMWLVPLHHRGAFENFAFNSLCPFFSVFQWNREDKCGSDAKPRCFHWSVNHLYQHAGAVGHWWSVCSLRHCSSAQPPSYPRVWNTNMCKATSFSSSSGSSTHWQLIEKKKVSLDPQIGQTSEITN